MGMTPLRMLKEHMAPHSTSALQLLRGEDGEDGDGDKGGKGGARWGKLANYSKEA